MRIFTITLSIICLNVLLTAASFNTNSAKDLYYQIRVNEETAIVEKGVEAAETIIRLIRSDEFHKLLDVIGVLGGPIAGTVTSILKVIIGKNSEAGSPELQFMKDAFEQINSKLESLTHEFKEVKELIDWSTVQVSFGTYERSIRALKKQLELIVNAPKESIDDMRSVFLMKYESDYKNSAEKIYDAMVNTDLIFVSNLLEASAKFTNNYRSKVQRFGMGLLQLLLQAVEIQIAYYDLKYENENTSNYIKKIWDDRFNILKLRMGDFDEIVKKRWVSQMSVDSATFIREKEYYSDSEFSLAFYQFLAAKYPWRFWIVVASAPSSDSDKYSHYFCNGYVSLKSYNRNAIAASVDKNSSEFNIQKAHIFLNNLQFEEKSASNILSVMNNAEGQDAEVCSTYHLKLVVEESHNAMVAAFNSRVIDKTVCVKSFWGTTCYTVVLFG